MSLRRRRPLLRIVLLCLTGLLSGRPSVAAEATTDDAPRIVNLVNFIRLIEPRSEAVTEDVLFQTVVNQAELMKRHNLPGTFLLQYDALMDARYQELLKGLPADRFEVGAWWEIPQPLVEKAGLTWRGRYPWDWHADVGFASGYTPEEREKLADVYMADFHEAFGRYPKSVASWFIDAHTLRYLHDKYGIVASANCKDQIGTDGYTLWGGYWNQAYYPSKVNAYMPAQTEAGQIPVPIFRMLGSDPLRQYDTGVGHTIQGVISLEPVYRDSGGSPAWIDWYFKNFVEGECLAYNNTQAGQENSFTWEAMREGLEYQAELIARLRDEGKVRVETLEQSGEWFRKRYRRTPATAMTYLSPLGDDDRKTVWFNSRYYRASLIWEEGRMRVRDIHLFDERVESPILREKVTGPAVDFDTLPVVDGYRWSSRDRLAGLQAVTRVNGRDEPIEGGDPRVSRTAAGDLQVAWQLKGSAAELVVTLSEDAMRVAMTESLATGWRLQLTTDGAAALPFTDVAPRVLTCRHKGTAYRVYAEQGVFKPSGDGFCVEPDGDEVTLRFAPSRE